MKKKQTIAYLVGGFSTVALLLGIIMLFATKTITDSTAVTIICLSLASGLLLPNPISFMGLIAGISLLVLPPWSVGIILILIGTSGVLTNIFVSKRILKTA